jgi:hypothetical protein
VQERLAAESFDILQFLASHPESYLFLRRKQLDETTPNRIFIVYAAEVIANYIERVMGQSENMRPGEWHMGTFWHQYMRTSSWRA